MNLKIRILVTLCLLAGIAGGWLWLREPAKSALATAGKMAASGPAVGKAAAGGAHGSAGTAVARVPTLSTNKLAYRLSNTTNTLRELQANPRAILLANAFLDTGKPLNLKLPAKLRSQGDPGAYIVQARGPIGAAFRAALAAARAGIVSYIPNNAYLVKVDAGGAGQLAANPAVQAVLPYEPYYKLQPSLLELAVNQEALPPGTALTLGLFGADPSALAEIQKLGVPIIGQDQSPFGPVVRVLPPADWTELAQSPAVQYVEPAFRRRLANDLARVTLDISPDTTSPMADDYAVNGQVLNGNNVTVVVNDTGIDADHPDFGIGGSAQSPDTAPPSRIKFLTPLDLVDTNGHGTHVAGIIAGNGSMSLSPTNVGTVAEGSVPNADFRGKAPLAWLFSVNDANYSDYQLQTNAAANALISNNSWDYGNGDSTYDLAAASYDFATRDAVPGQPGSQPVLFVFASGNDGGGSDDGTGGAGDTILSPGTAKNVITVGALEQLRDITNIVTTITEETVTNGGTIYVTNQVQYWLDQTDSGGLASGQVASYSGRGNVGIGTEGNDGRFKPDVVAPGTFVVSTSSQFNRQWDTNAYYNPTNVSASVYTDQVASTNALVDYNVDVPPDAVGVTISIYPNNLSPVPFPNLVIYCQQSAYPDPVNDPGAIDLISSNNTVTIPPGAKNCTLPNLQGNGFYFAVGVPTNLTANYDLTVDVLTTNDVGNLYSVLEGMNDSLGGYYRYETGTSLAAAGVSGVLALIQDYFTNQMKLIPSPALMKAVLINGARSVGDYGIEFTNGINFQGWGLPLIDTSVPVEGLFNKADGSTTGSSFFVDQDPSKALATGDSHTFFVDVSTNEAASGLTGQDLYLQATLVWTDPPGDPSAAIKLVNSLVLIVTNLDTGDVNYGSVYVGNDIEPNIGYNLPTTNAVASFDTINNVENVIIPPSLGARYSVTVAGRQVNVNAVAEQTNNAAGQYAPNIVQDFALVIAVGEGEVTNAITVTDGGIVSRPTDDQDLTAVLTTNAPLSDQLVGASSPLLGTNTLGLGTNTGWGSSGVLTIGQTNQWHFYVVTNNGLTADYTNAAFLIFGVSTLSIPRMGVYEQTIGNATTPEANLDLFVSQDPSLTNLNPVVISNCLAGRNNCRAGVANAGTQFAFYTNSSPGQVYYVGVQSQDQMAAEYSFMPIFTDVPFSSLDQNGNQIVNGLLLPMPIPTGNNAHPGLTNIFALAVIPMQVEQVIVTNLDEHQNFGDLFGSLEFGNKTVVLNNHDGFGNTFGRRPIVYDDSVNPPLGTTNTDGPGKLTDYQAKSALGPWILSVLDDSAGGYTGQVSKLTLLIQPHRDLKYPGIFISLPPGGWFYDWVDVPAGYTNLTFYGTNVTTGLPPGTAPVQMYELLGNDPTETVYDQEATLTNGAPPGNLISVGPPLPMGRYFVGLYNPDSTTTQTIFLSATLGIGTGANDIYTYQSGTSQSLGDDAVTPAPAPTGGATPGATTAGATVVVPAGVTNLVSSVNVGIVVKTPRISDYAFTLVSPTGERVLLMENRGGADTNGAGLTFVYTNEINSTATGGGAPQTNYLTVYPNPTGVTVPLTWNFYTVPDQMTVYGTTNPANFVTNSAYCLYNTGFASNAPTGGGGAESTLPFTTNLYVPAGYTNITIIMNQFGNPYASQGDAWIYSAGAPSTNYEYLMFTDDTNLATVPIKFAPTPFSLLSLATNFTLSDFNLATNGNYHAVYGPVTLNDNDQFGGGWTVPPYLEFVSVVETNGHLITVTNYHYLNNLVSVVSDPTTALGGDAGGSNYLALGLGAITRPIPTVPGRIYNVTFWYRGPGIEAWWRGEGNANDSSDPENNNNNGQLIGRFNFPAGEVGQAFGFEDQGDTYQFAGTNTYVQVPASPSLNVGADGGFTVEGWINPTNVSRPEPLVEWLARVPTNAATADTNLAIVQGPVLNPATGHYYYLLAATNWQTSETWAEELNGHLVTLETANEDEWVYDTFTAYGTLNRDLWTGLNDTNGVFEWSSGSSSFTYTNWAPGEPAGACVGANYVAIMGPTNAYPGLWQLLDNAGQGCASTTTNLVYGVVEAPTIPTNGVQFWVGGTNGTPGYNALPGSLCANIMDTNSVSHWLWSAPGLLTNNVYQHVALTFNTNSGIAALYLNGTNVATSNLYAGGVSFVPKTDGDVLLGYDLSLYTNNYFGGEMDEMSIYGRALSLAEISAIYEVSAFSTNRMIGKFDPAVTPATGLAEALVEFGSSSNVIYGVNDEWQLDSYTFTATTNSMPLTIEGMEPGMLLDNFTVEEAPQTNLYYFPEQPLSTLNGATAAGNWTLQVWDSRAGAYVQNVNQLVNWELSFVLVSNAEISATLPPQTPVASTVEPGATTYYAVPVPDWANEATNLLVSSSEPVNLFYYSPANPPASAAGPNATLLNNATGGPGSPILAVNPVGTELPLQRGTTYYLGVQNNSSHAASVTLEVDFDITGLPNGTPFTGNLTHQYNPVRYFSYDVSSNAYEATFQLLQLSGNADLVVSKGGPLPALSTGSYGSFNNGAADQNIYVFTNSTPVPLSAGRWYLGVINRGSPPLQYSVLAKELDLTNLALPTGVMPAIIDLADDVPVTWTAGPGAALTNFFRFHATNSVVNGTNVNLFGLRFELYNLTGNGDLTLQSNSLPLAPPFYQSSQNAGTSPELIVVYTNNVQTNLAGDWYLGVPNRETNTISYTIVAEVLTNLYFPAFPTAQGAGESAVGAGHAGTISTVYHVISTADSGPGTLRDAVSATNRTVVFDIGGTINLQSPLVITNSYLTIAGQTSPGGGITVAGDVTTVTNAHDVVMRDVRFRTDTAATPPGVGDSLQFNAVSNIMADHLSVSLAATNLLAALNATNLTVQWSVIANGSGVTNPAVTGSLLREGSGALSFHHNLYTDNYTGSPRLGDDLTLDFVNNVIYNWGLFSGLSDGAADETDFSPAGATNQLNYVCNYLIAGPATAGFGANFATTNIAFYGGTTNGTSATWIFQTNNFIDSDTNGVLNGADTGWGMFTNNYTPFSHPFATVPVSVDEAYLAYEKVLDFAGVNLSLRDALDANIVLQVRDQSAALMSSSLLSGIIAWWKGEDNALDCVGNNNGTMMNSAGFAGGEVGQAFNFPAVSNPGSLPTDGPFVQVPYTNYWALGANDFTIELWANFSAVPNGPTGDPFGGVMIADDQGSGGSNKWVFAVADGVLEFHINGPTINGGAGVFLTAPFTPVAGQWYHLAVTRNGNTYTFYADGVAIGTQTDTHVIPAPGVPLTIGTAEGFYCDGRLDEVTIYGRALSNAEIAQIYTLGSAGKSTYAVASKLPYLDTDQDGLPDFWEYTFTTNLVFVPSNNHDRDGDGYTDLEEYNNWLAGPHALTVTNTPVGVDLYQLCGESGHLAFYVTNGIHGSVYLTNVLGTVTNTSTSWSNTIAVFTPNRPNYSGYASFDFFVTNLDTAAYFGPVTVSVIISAVPIVLNSNMPPVITPLSSGVALDPTNFGGSDFYSFVVPAGNYSGALFEIDNPTGPMAMVISDVNPYPSLSSYVYYTNMPAPPASLEIVVLTNSTPVALHPGTWYMAAVNESGSNVVYTAKATLLGVIQPPLFYFPTNGMVTNILETVPFSLNCVGADLDSPPLSLSFTLVSGPTNMSVSAAGVLTWTPTEAQGPSTNTVKLSVSNAAYSVTNAFTIVVEESNLPPVLPLIPNQLASVGSPLVVTNTATDPDIPANILTYTLTSTVTGSNQPVINSNGVITWTPAADQGQASYLFTTVVTDYNPWAVNAKSLSDTNQFYVSVLAPVPPGGGPQTNTTASNSITWYAIKVSPMADMATNTLVFASAPVNLWYTTNLPPSITNAGAAELLSQATNGARVVTLTSVPALVPGSSYYLGVQNLNGYPVTAAVAVTFHLGSPDVFEFSVVYTNLAGTNGFLVRWLSPASEQFHLQWSRTLAPYHPVDFNGVISVDSLVNGTNGEFAYFDNGSQTGGFGAARFYRLLWVNSPSNTPPFFAGAPATFYYARPLVPFVYTNLAEDWDVPPQVLSYSVSNSLASADPVSIDSDGVITWVPTLADLGRTNFIATTVTDSGVPPRSAMNSFGVIVTTNEVAPVFGRITVAGNGVTFGWTAPAGEQFDIRWTTNLALPNWQLLPGPITSATTNFSYVDTNTPLASMKFYQLILLP